MTTVDRRVVDMQFNNSSFDRGVSGTLGLLERLKQSLTFTGAGRGVQELGASMDQLEQQPGRISGAFVAMSTVAITALANITNRAVDAGINVGKALTVKPLMDGFREYELNMNSIQTILSNTKDKGENLKTVTAALDELNEYADQTIYNFAEMTRNIGTFTAAGVGLDESTAAIKGIANMAAISGSNSQQASAAMYQLSQAMAQGYAGLQDWNSVVNAGMGGELLQKTLWETGKALGTFTESPVGETFQEWKDAGGSFRKSLESGWLTTDVMSTAFGAIGGELDEAALKAKGFTDEQAKAMVALGKTGIAAATEMKTATQVIQTIQEVAGSGWAKTWQLIIGDFSQAKKLWTNVGNTLLEPIEKMADARNKLFQDWGKMGGRTALFDGLQNGFEALLSVLRPIRDGFRDIFPPMTAKRLVELTEGFRDFTAGLILSDETSEKLRGTFAGIFSVFKIFWNLLRIGTGIFMGLVGAIFPASNGFLALTSGAGGFLKYISDLLSGVEVFNGQLSFTKTMGERVASVWERFKPIFEGVKKALRPLIDGIAEVTSGFGEAFSEGLGSGSFDTILDMINTGLLGGIALLLKKFFSEGFGIDIGGGLLEGLKDTFGALTDHLGAMTAEVKSNALLKIAGAVAVLALAVVMLAGIDSEALTKSLTAITVGMAQLLTALYIISNITGPLAAVKMVAIANAMLILSFALLVLSTAVKKMSELSWEELARGLVGIGGALGIMVGAMTLLSKQKGGVLRASFSILIISGALNVLAEAVDAFSDFSWRKLGKGLLGVAVALGIMVAALWLMPPSSVLNGVGLLLVATAMKQLAKSIKSFGGMTIEEIAKGLGFLAGALLTLAGGLYLMSGTLMGSVSLMAAALALRMLVPVLIQMGEMDIMTMVKSLGFLAAVFIVIGLGALIMAPIIPVLIGLGVALLMLGAGLALIGVAGLAFATSMSIIAVSGVAAAAGITAVLTAIIDLIPRTARALGVGFVVFAQTIAASAPVLVGAFFKVVEVILDNIIKLAPKIGEAFTVLIRIGARVIRDNAGVISDAGFFVLITFLERLRDNIGGIADVATDLILEWMKAIDRNRPRLIQQGTTMIINYINELAKAIDKNAPALGRAGANLGIAIVTGMAKGLWEARNVVMEKAREVAQQAINAVKEKFQIFSPSRAFAELGYLGGLGLGKGFTDSEGKVKKDSAHMASAALETVKATMSKVPDILEGDKAFRPVISPVLDLDALTKKANSIDGLLGANPLNPSLSLSHAGSISESMSSTRERRKGELAASPTTFIQNNNSPKSLPAAEIYRNTKTLLKDKDRKSFGFDEWRPS